MSDPGEDVEVEELLFFDTFSHEMNEVSAKPFPTTHET